MKITTLCYIEHDGQYLMLHRIKKENDINEGNFFTLKLVYEGESLVDQKLEIY